MVPVNADSNYIIKKAKSQSWSEEIPAIFCDMHVLAEKGFAFDL